MAMMMVLTNRPAAMAGFPLPRGLRRLGWLATLVMAATVAAMAASRVA